MSSLNHHHLPSPAPTPDDLNLASTPAVQQYALPPGAEQAAIRAEVEQHLLRLSQDLYEMEICAGDVGQGMEGAVPGYMAKINQSFKVLSDLSGRLEEGVPRQVIDKIDGYSNPHIYTKATLVRATGENQYALGRMLGLESFRRQLHDALASDFPQIPLPDRRHAPVGQGDMAVDDQSEDEVVKREANGHLDTSISGEAGAVKREAGTDHQANGHGPV